jgi:dihydroneopterin aldolase
MDLARLHEQHSPGIRAPRARAAASEAGPLADRIYVRDYTRSVEIGAFATERGVARRVRFNIVFEVCHSAAAAEDDVDQVLSYDTITEAIEAEIAAERINLLETLAERVAVRCLADPRALRAFVRIEKLDRIPGAVGVEIVRARSGGLPRSVGAGKARHRCPSAARRGTPRRRQRGRAGWPRRSAREASSTSTTSRLEPPGGECETKARSKGFRGNAQKAGAGGLGGLRGNGEHHGSCLPRNRDLRLLDEVGG